MQQVSIKGAHSVNKQFAAGLCAVIFVIFASFIKKKTKKNVILYNGITYTTLYIQLKSLEGIFNYFNELTVHVSRCRLLTFIVSVLI